MVQNSVAIGKPIIGVSINYRLSVWGFLAGEEILGSGNSNCGFRDQRLALHWAQENIEAFGGTSTSTHRLKCSFTIYWANVSQVILLKSPFGENLLALQALVYISSPTEVETTSSSAAR